MVIPALLVILLLILTAMAVNFFRPKGKHTADSKHSQPPQRKKIIARGKGISLLVPFRTDGGARQEVWDWLHDYWSYHLPGAEICMGTNHAVPFSKTAAVNQAAVQSTGDIIVVLDADCYISVDIVESCVQKIRDARVRGRKLWYVPYRRFYRLTQDATNRLTASAPHYPVLFPDPPLSLDTIPDNASASSGHWYGALIQIMPQEAFAVAGGMDERFAGWGGEDHAFMEAVDTLYAKHKTTDNQVLHLWHPTIEDPGPGHFRRWEGQQDAHVNDALVAEYHAAFGDRQAMAELVSHGQADSPVVLASNQLPVITGFVRDEDAQWPSVRTDEESLRLAQDLLDTPTDQLDTRQLVLRQVSRELTGDYDYLYQPDDTRPIG